MASSSVLAAQMYTLRDFLKTPADIAKTLARVKKMGYDAIQNSALGPIDPKELAAILKGEGLTCCVTHFSWDRMKSEPEKVAEEHRLWGCKYIAIGGMPGIWDKSIPKTEERFRSFAAEANEVGKSLKKHGLYFGYHNHKIEFQKFGGKTIMDLLMELTEPENVFFELDTFWVQYGGGDPAAWIRKAKGRIPVLHLKDMTIIDDEVKMAEVGEGNMNFPEILKACKEAGVEWYVVEQDICQRDPFESLAISLKNLHAMGIR